MDPIQLLESLRTEGHADVHLRRDYALWVQRGGFTPRVTVPDKRGWFIGTIVALTARCFVLEVSGRGQISVPFSHAGPVRA
jgi:hypothetical protein